MEETVHGIARISLPGSTLKRGERVNVFWHEKAGILVDVGWNTDESFAALQAALPEPPRHVLVTHLHPDHGGALERIRAWSDGEVWIPQEDRFVSEFPLPEGVRYFQGEEPLTFGATTVDVLLTPGHTPGHRCFLFRNERALVTGDMVLGEGTTWVGPPHGDMAQYMASLERLRGAGHQILCPGHGPIQTDPLLKIDEFLQHRRKREQQVLDALAEGMSVPAAIVARNYADTPAYLHPLAEIVVKAHLAKLVHDGKVREHEGHYGLAGG
jgi:glyoxylase-like metal-dependent hydrolase (beta-lactamase superfamily II)